ncbi:hypothetical protein AGMMS49938_13110 [Fibrobacterales bacterium]|nr:hypothetical protein AGMMS49938_13110 [Fibrobacterales bacterium]
MEISKNSIDSQFSKTGVFRDNGEPAKNKHSHSSPMSLREPLSTTYEVNRGSLMKMRYFQTRKIKTIELKFAALLRDELSHLPKQLTIEQIPQHIDRIKTFTDKCHYFFDEYISQVLKQHTAKISCKANCPNCCHHYPMSIEPFELISIYSTLREQATAVQSTCEANEKPHNEEEFALLIEGCLKREREYNHKLTDTAFDIDTALQKYFSLAIPCPFLYGGNCGIHEYRPFTCQMYFCMSDPKYCDPKHLQPHKNKSFAIYLPEHLENLILEISAHYSSIDLQESLYGGIAELHLLMINSKNC